MSNKGLRRALKEREESTAQFSQESSDSDDANVVESRKINKFSFLDCTAETTESEEDNGQSDSQPELAIIGPAPDSAQSSRPAKSGNKRAKNRRSKAKKATAKDEVHDEIPVAPKSAQVSVSSVSHLWRIDPRSLDADLELKRLLGRSLGEPVHDGGRQRPRNARTMYAGKIVKAKDDWPMIRQLGLSMVLEKEEGQIDGQPIRWFRFKHTQRYQLLQQMFWLHQEQQDYNSIMDSVLAEQPYHLDSLLTLADVFHTLHGEHQQARDFVERGLYACESVFHSQFQLLSPTDCLSYRWRENRPFFLLLQRHVQMLSQRRCFGTALQFAKILLAKDMTDDSLAIVLSIDSLALLAKDYRFIIEFYQAFVDLKNLDLFPNFLYSVALAHFLRASKETANSDAPARLLQAKELLKVALTRFPFMLGQILDKLQIYGDQTIENSYIINSSAINREPVGLKLISRIYLHHSEELWKQADVLKWLECTTSEILPEILHSQEGKTEVEAWAERRKKCFVGVPLSIKRHAFLHSINFADLEGASESQYFTDPYPSKSSNADYAKADVVLTPPLLPNAQAPADYGGNPISGLVRSLVPDDLQPRLNTIGDMMNSYTERIIDQFKRLGFLTTSEGQSGSVDMADTMESE